MLLGQYSVVSYIHELSNEHINLGILVWHPVLRHAIRFAKNLRRVRTIDAKENLSRVRSELDEIQKIIETWHGDVESPLEYLTSVFRHRVVVSPPQNARIQDLNFTLERLCSFLMPSEPYQ